MKRLREYLKERNIPEDSLEANSILEGYEKGYQDAIDKACQWLMKYFVLDHEGMSPSGYGVFEFMFCKAMEE